VHNRGAQAAARGAATLSQQDKKNSADVQRNRVNIPVLTAQWQGNPRGDIPSTSSSRWP
jgi:hypothetical protein